MDGEASGARKQVAQEDLLAIPAFLEATPERIAAIKALPAPTGSVGNARLQGADIKVRAPVRASGGTVRLTVRNKEELAQAIRGWLGQGKTTMGEVLKRFVDDNHPANLVKAAVRHALNKKIRWLRREKDGSPYLVRG